jgi:hypothetical protein
VAGVAQTVSTVNSLIRTLLLAAVLLLVGGAGWWGFKAVQGAGAAGKAAEGALAEARAALDVQARELAARDQLLAERGELLAQQQRALAQRDQTIGEQARAIDALEADLAVKAARIERLETAMRLLKVDHRLARLTVLEQSPDPATGEIRTRLEFVELDERGAPLDTPREFVIRGDVVYVDNWVVKFDDAYIEQQDLLRSASLVLFRRIFGEFQEPTDGFAVDQVGQRPRAYGQGTIPGEFEEKIWRDFWTIANDPARAAQLGIRAAHGEAVSMKVRPGRRYRLVLRASDGLSIVPEDGPGRPPA